MKGWAAQWVMELQEGETTQFRPKGKSMEPLIKRGQLVTVEPIKDHNLLTVGDIVLCQVSGAQYLHKILAVGTRYGKLEFQIGNNKGKMNGWTTPLRIYGKLIKVED